MREAIEETIHNIKKQARGRATGFVIGNTSDLFPKGRYYDIPLRETSELLYGGVIVRDVETAQKIAQFIDGKIEYVFVDDEKKIRKIYYGPDDVGNIEKPVRAIIQKSKLLTYKGNDLAVEAVDMLLGGIVPEVSGMRAAIIGMGNLGSKIALKLVERGVHVTAFRRDKEKLRTIVEGLNHVRSEYTLARITPAESILEASRNAQVVLGVTNEKEVINKNMLRYSAPVTHLVDVGKGCFAKDIVTNPSFLVYRVDVSIVQRHIFSGLIHSRAHLEKSLGRRVVPEIGVTLISMGLLGRKGEVVVDDIKHPSSIIGIVAEGGVLEKNTPKIQKKIKEIKKFFKIR